MANHMSIIVSFVGQTSGDHECFCWDVSREQWIAMTGDTTGPDKMDESIERPGLYRLYPDEVFHLMDMDPAKKYKFSIKVEEAE